MTQVRIDLQKVSSDKYDRPHKSEFKRWSEYTIEQLHALYPDNAPRTPVEICVRIVDADESAKINNTFRDVNRPTNVLSFPIKFPDEEPVNLIGDIVLCGEIVAQEASEQKKNIKSHWMHLFVHSILHLCGFDHEDERHTEIMESCEIQILKHFDVAHPY